jgi:ATPase subunit of ABC transporter with duplicated ATPase domains
LLIRPGDRIALLGPNGTGKSTVLKLLAGELSADAGDVRMLGRASVAYLQQSQQQSGDGSVLDALLEPFAHLRAMHDEMAALEARWGPPIRRISSATASCKSATASRAATTSKAACARSPRRSDWPRPISPAR